jgi:FKBP-type peptidyl-prolyl cis-trans isomerase FklB
MNRLKKILITLALVSVNLPVMAIESSSSPSQENLELSYAIGFKMGQAFKNNNIPVDVTYFTRGIKDGLADTSTPYLSDETIERILKNFQNKTIAEKQKALNVQAKENLAQGKAFLKENAQKPGIIVLGNGLQYQILKSGTSDTKPTSNSTVVVSYIGTHLNGEIFDQSKESTFQVSNVIAGWQRILPMMKVGDKWKVYIPSSLAYGPGGAPDIIGPNETIVYTITLLKVTN